MIHSNDYELKMRDYKKEEYQNKMKAVCGKKVVEYFGKFGMKKEEKIGI